MSSELLKILELPERSRPDSTAQNGEFAQQFRSGLSRVNQHMQVLAAQANQREYQKLDENRQSLIAAYQKASALGDSVKNQKVIDALVTLEQKVSAKLANVTTVLTEWQELEEEFELTRAKISELEDAQVQDGTKLRAVSDAIQSRVMQGEFSQAIVAFGQLSPKVSQAHALQIRQIEGDEVSGEAGSGKSTSDIGGGTQQMSPGAPSQISISKPKSAKPADYSTRRSQNWAKVLPDYNRIIRREPPDSRRQQIRDRIRQVAKLMWHAVDVGLDEKAAYKHSEELVSLVQRFNEATAKLYRVDDPASRYRFEVDDFERRHAEVVKKFPPTNPSMEESIKKMQFLKVQMKNRALNGDYKQAVKDLDQLEDMLYDYKSGSESEKKSREERSKFPLKYEYETQFFDLEDKLHLVLAKRSKNEGIIRLQNEIKAKKSEMEQTASKGNYALALTQLKAISTLMEKFYRTRDCQWVTKKASLLHALIHKHYLRAGERLEDAAKAYDEALKKHKKTISKNETPIKGILVDLFFVALGGGLGGAAAVGMKSHLTKRFTEQIANSKTGGALIDASKDIIKFGTRSIPGLGGGKDGSSFDLKIGSIEIGDNGVDLGRNLGKALKREGQTLLDKVIEPLRQIQEIDCDFETVEIDVDPVASLESDPFAKTLAELVEPSEKLFAQLIWTAWAKQASDAELWNIARDIREQMGTMDADLESRIAAEQKRRQESAERRSWRR